MILNRLFKGVFKFIHLIFLFKFILDDMILKMNKVFSQWRKFE